QIDGRLVNLRAANDLARFVRLRSGRLPQTCVPTHCEVLRLEGAGPVPSKSTLRLIEVGRATLLPSAPFAPWIQPVQSEQGARRWQVELHTFAETGAVALAGTVVGWCLGGVVAAFVASRAGSPPWQVVEHSLLTGGGIAAAACVAAAATLLLFLTVRGAPVDAGRFGLTTLDVAALAAVAL